MLDWLYTLKSVMCIKGILTSQALNDQSRKYANGLKPSSNALSSLITKVADAPSVKNDELAAVCVPCGLTKAGLSLPTLSIVDSALIPFSSVEPL